MYKLDERLAKLRPPVSKPNECKIRLDANESYKNLPDYMIEDIKEMIGNMEFNRYPDPFSTTLCEGFANYYGVKPEYVTAGNGSDELISTINANFITKGEKMIVVSPDFAMYQFYGELNEKDIIKIEKDEDFRIDIDEIINTCRESGARLICFSNPCNPTSLGVPREEVIRLVNNVDALVILDEAYMDFWDNKQSLLDVVGDFDNLIILRTCSKALGLAAVRIGFAVANETLTTVIKSVKAQFNMNTVAQIIGTALFKYPDHLEENTREIIEARDKLQEMLMEMNEKTGIFTKVYESNNNFVMVKTDDADIICQKLRERSISVANHHTFIRITVGRDWENEAVVKALDEISEELKA
ncbi:MAG: aminotransferase class I/II-fold pyridoxal phosphate-dependent enzyme [Firmicutes bacterium]|nr:aminotransferase class I/II-fold pyridoxal phosphate-dependent enzyme [Bacillota bacterium]